MEKRVPYDFNRVKSFTPGRNGARNMSGEKEQVARLIYIAPNPGFVPGQRFSRRYVQAVDVRVYMGRSSNASTVYASVWARAKARHKLTRAIDAKGKRVTVDNLDGIWASGRGSAGGYGYHKESAAIEDALTDAGFSMEGHFGGCGDTSAELAIEAVARYLGWKTGEVIRV
jgi:hypothetical protein